MRIIALEEHFVSQAFVDSVAYGLGAHDAVDPSAPEITDSGELRLKHMDDSGIDMQVISHVVPTFKSIPAERQVEIAVGANNQAARTVADHPDRFAAFAALPTGDPDAAVNELDRAVGEFGFVGALINGRADGHFLDHPSLFPVLELAAALDVPIYLHPGLPTESLHREHYSGLSPAISYALSTAPWGWHAETGLHVLRLIAARIFDRLPNLRIIIGHMGEIIPFMLERSDEWLPPPAQREGLRPSVADTFRSNFWVTTSGMSTHLPLQLPTEIIGSDHILFSVDFPSSTNGRGRAFLDTLPVSPADKAKISFRNAERLLKLPAT